MANAQSLRIEDKNGEQTVSTLDALMAVVATAAAQGVGNAKLDQLHSDLQALGAFVDGLEALAAITNGGNAAILAKLSGDPASQTTLAAILAKLPATPATEATVAALLAKVIAAPATEAKQDAAIASINKVGTRAYGTPVRQAVAAASAVSSAVTATEVMLHAKVACYFAVVPGTGSPTVAADAGIPLEAGEKFHVRITSGQRIAVIRDTEDGFLYIVPVA